MSTIQLDPTFVNRYTETMNILQRNIENRGDKWARSNLKKAVVFLAAPPPYSHLRVVLGEQSAAVGRLAEELGVAVLPVSAGETAGIALETVQPVIRAWDAPVAY